MTQSNRYHIRTVVHSMVWHQVNNEVNDILRRNLQQQLMGKTPPVRGMVLDEFYERR